MKGNFKVKEPIIPYRMKEYRCFRAVGKPGRLDGDLIKDSHYNTVARVNGDIIKDAHYNIMYRFDGDYVKDAHYNIVARLDGDCIKDAHYNILFRIEGYLSDDQLSAFLVFYL